jgi:hypothetical protein
MMFRGNKPSAKESGWMVKTKDKEMIVKAPTEAEDLEWYTRLQVGSFAGSKEQVFLCSTESFVQYGRHRQ